VGLDADCDGAVGLAGIVTVGELRLSPFLPCLFSLWPAGPTHQARADGMAVTGHAGWWAAAAG
jgi:hypothetical protein